MSARQLFTGVPFVAGSIRGERSWNWEGRVLRSPAYPHDWVEGENTSICQRPVGSSKDDVRIALEAASLVPQRATVLAINASPLHEYIEVEWEVRMTAPRIPDPPVMRFAALYAYAHSDNPNIHGIAKGVVRLEVPFLENLLLSVRHMLPHSYGDCHCGFYGYLNGFNEYNHITRVTGIIEGYGNTYIGTRGFRAEKARILALAPGIIERMPRDISDASSINVAIQRLNRALDDRKPPKIKQLRKAYPNIPVFEDIAQMRAEFPPTDIGEIMGLKE